MGIRVTISVEGVDAVVANLSSLQGQIPQRLERGMGQITSVGEAYWRSVTPFRTGKLAGGDVAEPSGLVATFRNSVYYYKFVDAGHWTPKGWHTRRGYRLAKRRSHVAGRLMTSKTAEFLKSNAAPILVAALNE